MTALGRSQQIPFSSDRDPAQLVRRAVENEETAARESAPHFLFRGIKTTPKGSTTRIYVEAKDATAGLVIAYNNQALMLQQQRDEEARVERFIHNPEELERKRQQERENTERSLRIIRALPNAFLYEYAGEESSTAGEGRREATFVRLNFRPNPRYDPPSRVEEILTGMHGSMLIDIGKGRLAKIDGTLVRDVGFGWGLLGHLDRGGRFVVEQQELSSGSWQVSSLSLNFTGRILLVKSLAINSTETFSEYRLVPSDLTFTQALDLLKKEGARLAEKSSSSSRPSSMQQK